MGRRLSFLLALLLAVSALAVEASAASLAGPQKSRPAGSTRTGFEGVTLLRLHVGLSAPTGNFSDTFNSGLGVGANVAYGVSRNVFLSAGVAYHNFNGDGFDGDATIVPVTFNVEAVLPSSGKVHPYIGGGFGFYNIEVESNAIFLPPGGSNTTSETNTGINIGAGVGSRSGDRDVWGVGFRYHHIFEGDTFNDLDFVTFQVAYGFAI